MVLSNQVRASTVKQLHGPVSPDQSNNLQVIRPIPVGLVKTPPQFNIMQDVLKSGGSNIWMLIAADFGQFISS